MKPCLCSIFTLFCLTTLPGAAYAQDEVKRSSEPVKVAPIEIQEGQNSLLEPFLPDKEEEKIYSGKKATVVDLESLPQITTNNYRQALSQIPGLLTSEVNNESFASFNYRGIGDPHESFNLLVLADGFPINVDPYGYPGVYYSPPIELISSVEFIRGGASLLYGPLPGGALNYVLKEPSREPFTFSTKHVVGSKNLYSTHSEVSGTVDNVGYLASFHHRESDGFRTFNSDYAVNNGIVRLTFAPSVDTRALLHLDVYSSDHGEPGGLAHFAGEGTLSYEENRLAATRRYDRLRLERYVPTLTVHHDISSTSSFTLKGWGGMVRRYSRRQLQGDTPVFGGIPNGEGTTVTIQEFITAGAQGRFAQEWNLGGLTQDFSVGYTFMSITSPFTEQRGETPQSDAGPIQRKLDRQTFANALYVENTFRFSPSLKITPGMRLENIYQDIEEKRNVQDPLNLRSTDDNTLVPLFGLGVAYEVGAQSEVYANVSQGYRPVTYQDAVPLGPGDTISSDLDETNIITYEAGVKGSPNRYLTWDSSIFYIDFTDQVGRVGTEIQNVGDARHYGAEFASAVSLTSLFEDSFGYRVADTTGDLSWQGNISLLDAEFTKGPVEGNTPQYAPRYLFRNGLVYRKGNTKVSLLGTFVDHHYGDDSNVLGRKISSYKVWDLTAEIPVFPKNASIVTGVNNLFNEEYYSRVRGNGIEPGLPRNWYAGISLKF